MRMLGKIERWKDGFMDLSKDSLMDLFSIFLMWSISITDYFLTPVISSIYKMVHLPFTSMLRIYWCYGLSMDGLIIYIPVHKFLDGGSVVAQLHWLNAGLNGWLMAWLMDGLMNRLIWWKDVLIGQSFIPFHDFHIDIMI